MKSCLLVGASGNPNFGDEAIMRVWIYNYLEILQDGVVFCDGWGGELKRCIDVMHVNNVFVASDVQSVFKTTKHFTIDNDKISINDIDSYKDDIKSIAQNLKEFGIQSIHLFGGGYINSMWPHQTYILILSSLLIACEANIPVFATGLGLLPCKPSYYNYLKLLNYFSSCDVRDKESFSLLLSLCNKTNLSYSGDDVLLSFGGSENYLVKEEVAPSLVIGLQNDLFQGDSLLPKILSEDSLSVFLKRGIKSIKFISAMHTDSRIEQQDTLDRVRSYGFSVSYIDSFDLIEHGIPVHKDSFFVTSRYHIHLIASLWGSKGVALSSNQYYDIKHASVNMMGSSWNIISLDNAQHIFSNYEQIEKIVEAAIPNNQQTKKHFISKKAMVKEKIINQINGYTKDGFDLDMACDLIRALIG